MLLARFLFQDASLFWFKNSVLFRSTPSLLSCLFRSTPSLLCQGGLHILTKPSLLRREGCNRPPVLFLPHLSLPCGRVLNPLPSPRPFQKGKGCNRPAVLSFSIHPVPPLPRRAPPLSPSPFPLRGQGMYPPSGAQNRFALRLAGHQSPRHILRDGTAWGQLASFPRHVLRAGTAWGTFKGKKSASSAN